MDTAIGIASARDHLSKRIESFSKGIMETLKFGDKRLNRPFEFEIEIGATEIKESQEERPGVFSVLQHRGGNSVSNGNAGDLNDVLAPSEDESAAMHSLQRRGSSFSDEDDIDGDKHCYETLRLFEARSASIFHTLLPLVFAHIGTLASHDPKVSLNLAVSYVFSSSIVLFFAEFRSNSESHSRDFATCFCPQPNVCLQG